MKIDSRTKVKQILFQIAEEYCDGDYENLQYTLEDIIEELKVTDLDYFLKENKESGYYDNSEITEATYGMIPHSELAKRLALDVRKERRKD